MKIISVVGARPNFMKIAPVHRAIHKYNTLHSSLFIHHLICHTGQHYDSNMSDQFFNDLELPSPDYYLGVGSGTHAVQTAKIMVEFEKVLNAENPDLVIIVGDVNSTIACSLTAVKMGIKVAHVEAGLRSFDRTMPEEINRILTDSISDFLFVTEKSGLDNLKREGVPDNKVFFVGNCMIDSLIHYLPKAETSNVINNFLLLPFDFILVTLHRPSNVDDPYRLKEILEFLCSLSNDQKVIFPVHPRTRNIMEANQLQITDPSSLILTEPLGYIEFLSLMKNASLVITDSGGIQEETTYLQIPCVTLRSSTERPVTIDVGTNYLVGEDLDQADRIVTEILSGKSRKGQIPKLWDGKAAERIVSILVEKFKKN
ncbi:MAG: UDP-N-acetylglucosamine 2-epimerase (non-hydrolyzing) [Melioribacteraceae bacterium]|nr:UDP-N-acetylglucosamine 2-epimerase (non-hydrolyzing) [Melioribacteraceae bacterium]